MALTPYVQPTPDFTTGHIVTPQEWNSNFDDLANYLNNTIKPAIDALNTGGLPVVGSQGTVQGRLTLASGDPIGGNTTGGSTIYWTPFLGNQMNAYNTGVWSLKTFTETSLSLAGLPFGQMADIFGFFTGNVFTMEMVQWASVVASNNPAAGTNVVINVPSTTNLTAGDIIAVAGGGNTNICRVNSVTVGTSITVDVLANSFTAPTIYCTGANGRATALSFLDGIPVKSTQLNKIYLGSVRASSGGTVDDTTSRRFLWNYWNRVTKTILAVDTTASWAYSGGWRAANASTVPGVGRAEFIVGVQNSPFHATSMATYVGANIQYIGLGFDSLAATPQFCNTPLSINYGPAFLHTNGLAGPGLHYVQSMEKGDVNLGGLTGYGNGFSSMRGFVIGV